MIDVERLSRVRPVAEHNIDVVLDAFSDATFEISKVFHRKGMRKESSYSVVFTAISYTKNIPRSGYTESVVNRGFRPRIRLLRIDLIERLLVGKCEFIGSNPNRTPVALKQLVNTMNTIGLELPNNGVDMRDLSKQGAFERSERMVKDLIDDRVDKVDAAGHCYRKDDGTPLRAERQVGFLPIHFWG